MNFFAEKSAIPRVGKVEKSFSGGERKLNHNNTISKKKKREEEKEKRGGVPCREK